MSVGYDLGAVDFYARLGLGPTASAEEIRRAYLSLVRKFTPEREPEAFKRIREAYETLNNPVSRRQYDSRPDPKIALFLEQASLAMGKKDYGAAEQAYKRVLLESPGLLWVRNLLGLCFLYQNDARSAIAQYERILKYPCEDAATHGNAGHAYCLAKRYQDAEREFRIAKQLGGDESAEYGLALIQILSEEGKNEEAYAMATKEAESARSGTSAAVDYACRRIELALVTKRQASVPALVAKASNGVISEEQRRYAAYALGRLAIRLITAQLFKAAESVASSSSSLQPDDPDYDALEQASGLLFKNDFAATARLLNTHVSFSPNGWLSGLKPTIQDYCAKHAAFDRMVPIDSPPPLWRINGVGTTIMGKRDVDAQTGTYVATLYFTFVFVPLFPITSYRVRPAPKGGWFFLGRVNYGRAQKIHWLVFLALGMGLLLNSLAQGYTPQGGGSQLGSSSLTNAVANTDPRSPNDSRQLVSANDGEGQSPDSDKADSIVGANISAHTSSQSSRRAISVYNGEATNTILDQPGLQGSIRLTVRNWRTGPNGYLRVSRPLDGSGNVWIAAKGDSVRIVSVSATGDTIVWLGKRVSGQIEGLYGIVGGRHSGQRGDWYVTHSAGDTIPSALNDDYW